MFTKGRFILVLEEDEMVVLNCRRKSFIFPELIDIMSRKPKIG